MFFTVATNFDLSACRVCFLVYPAWTSKVRLGWMNVLIMSNFCHRARRDAWILSMSSTKVCIRSMELSQLCITPIGTPN